MQSSLQKALVPDYADTELAVRQSLQRSHQYGLKPNLDGAPESSCLSESELKGRIDRHLNCYTLAKKHVDSLYRLLEGSCVCVTYADADGYVLYVSGDASFVEQRKRRRCIPGYRRTEQAVGTCALALALERRVPVLLSGDQVFAVAEQRASHAAAPIFSADGAHLLGVIELSCDTMPAHPHTLGLVRQAAEAVSAQLAGERSLREQDALNHYLRSIAEADSRGRIAVDMDSRIVEITQTAKKLLNLSTVCRDALLTDSLRIPDIPSLLRQGKGFSMREVLAQHGGTTFLVSLNPMYPSSGGPAGGVVTIHSKQEIRRVSASVLGMRFSRTFDDILGTSKPLQAALQQARQAVTSVAPLFLCGEAGSGKTLFAQAIHNANTRRTGPFISLNCSSLSADHLERELFGMEDGANLPQRGGWPGKLELAEGGTVFLQEIDALPPDIQSSLLRVLQSGRIQRVGGLRSIPIDVRIIASSRSGLLEAVTSRAFLSDLFCKLTLMHISIPALRERPEDIRPLAEHCLSRQSHIPPESCITDDVLHVLQRFQWPENVRQLFQTIHHAVHLAQGGPLLPDHLHFDGHAALPQRAIAVGASLGDTEKYAIAATLARFQGNISRAAVALGISRPTLYRKMRLHNISAGG